MRPKEEFNRSNPNFNTLAVNPIQDFSPAVADKMDLARDVEYGDTRREYLRKADRIASGELDPDVIPRGYNRDLYANVFVRKAEDLAARERARQSMPENIMGMPSVMRLVNNAKRMGTDLTEADIRNLADWSMVNDAADIFVAAYQAGDPNAPQNIITSLAETNKYAAFMLPDIVEEKLRATVDDPGIVDTIVETAGKYIGDLLSPYFAAWEWTQRGVAAGNYRAARSSLGETPLSWVALAQGFASPSDRDATDPGSLNEEYIVQLAEAKNPDGTPVYTPLQIEIATDIVKLQAQGDPDPRKTLWGSKYAGNLQAQEIFTDLAFNRGDGTMQELMRQVMSADMSNVGQSFFGSSLTDLEYDPARGSEWRKSAADATGFAVGLIFDPTNLAFGAGRAFQAARWSLTRLAPNAETAAAAVLKGPAGRYFTRFTRDMNKLESMYAAADAADAAGQAGKAVRLRASAAEHRAGMSNRYNAMPEQLIEDFRVEMPRNADGVFDLNSVVEWIDSTNAAFRTAVGEAAPQFVAVGAADAAKRATLMKVLDDPEALAPAKQEAQDALLQLNQETEAAITPLRTSVQEALDKTFYGRVADTAQRREPLVPRLYAPGLLRQYAVNALRIGQASPLTIDRMIGKYFPNLSDPEKFADDLIENGQSLGAEVREFRAGAAMNPLTGPADSARRMFSSLPDVGVLSLSDASSTRAFYRYARQFFPKRMARLMAEQWRLGTPGSRRKMMTGVVRSAAAVRGIELSRLEVDELLDNGVTRMTGYRPGEQYGVKIAGPLLPSERAGLSVPIDDAPGATQLSLSADRNGVEHALHLEDTATQVRAPQLREFEELRRYGSLAEQGYYWTGRGLEGATNTMSFFTLFGLKFGLRNAIEEDGLFLFMGGSPVMLAKGRAADQALRRARPRLKPEIKIKDGAYTVVEKDGIPQIARKSSLGMIANKAEWLSLRLAEAGFPRWLTEFVYNSVDKETAYAAARAHAAGDGEAFSRLVVQSQVAHKLGGRKIFSMLSSDDMDGVGVLAESQHGMQLYDEIGESGGYLQNAGFPAFVIDSESINGAAPGIGWGKLSSQSNLKFGDYTNVAPVQIDQNTGKKILGASFWWDQLRKTLTTDGPIGEAAVRLLDKPIEAKAEIARIIREDTEFGYKEKLSRITDDLSIDEYANAYFENVFQHFTKSDGSLNLDLRARFMDTDPDTGLPVATFWQAADDLGEGMQTYRVPLSGLTDIPVADRPQFVFGREVQESTWIPVVETQAGLFQKGFNWLGRQNARLSRNPIFIANYLEQWRQTFPLRRSLANELAAAAGREAPSEADFLLANQLYGKKAMDSAYSLTLSYVDNPANRSNLAWKARNLARYYRASEDFWRRMKRVAVNRPETFWRAALTYSLLEDTSFTFRDDNGDLYFAYPGNSQMQQATAWFLDRFTGNKTYQFTNFDPFMMGGRVLGLAPSTDPNQQLPTFFGPTSVALTAIYDLFPALYKMKGLQKLTLGNYSNITGNTAQDVIAAATPPFIDRIINTLDPEQLDASLAQSGIGVITIMAASGMDTVTIEGKKYPLDQVTAEQFRQSEEYRAGQTLSLATFLVKVGMGVWAPAATKVMSNDVSNEARDLGITGMKPLFRSMIDDYAEQGYSDPWGAAYADWAALKLKEDANTPGGIGLGAYLPFTLSSYTAPSSTAFENTAALAGIKNASKELLAFYGDDSTQDLISKGYKLGTFFLAPKSGEFDWTAWNLVKNDLGLKVPKTENQMIEDFLALGGSYRDMVIRKTYSSYIEELNPYDADYKDQKKFYTDQMESALKENKNLSPSWRWKSGQGTEAFTQENFRSGFSEVNQMTNYLLERDGVLEGTALALRMACDIYLAYKPRAETLVGTSEQRRAQEAALDTEMVGQLNAIKENTPDAAPFIDGILLNLNFDPAYSSVFGAPNG